MNSSRLTVNLPASEISFLKQYAKRNKTTVPKLIDKWIKSLRTNPDIHPDIKKFTGIIPEDIDVDKVITEYIMEKHR